MRKVLLALFLSVFAVPLFAEALTPESIEKMSTKDIEKNLPDSNPGAYFSYAARLFKANKHDRATMWFYVGQIRYRARVLAHPENAADAAQFASLNKSFTQPITDWAGSDVRRWSRLIDEALAWDANNPNNDTAKDTYAAQLQQARAEVTKTRDDILKNEAAIKADRAARGIVDSN